MTLSSDDRAAIEVWTGEIPATREAAIEARVIALGSAPVAALEELMRIHATVLSEPAENRLDGDMTFSWAKNLPGLVAQIARCAGYCGRLTGLGTGAKAVVALATSQGQSLPRAVMVGFGAAYVRPGEDS